MAEAQLVHISGAGRNVGKTLLGERLVGQLASRGVDVCAVKHVHHGVDFRVKDTGRYLAAGARLGGALGPGEAMIVLEVEAALDRMLCWLSSCGCRVVVVEGFRSEASTLLEAGACTAYLEHGGSVRLSSRCGGWEGLSVDDAVRVLISLLGRGCCGVELGRLCGTTSLTPCPPGRPPIRGFGGL